MTTRPETTPRELASNASASHESASLASLQIELNMLSKEIDAFQRSIFNLVAIQDHIKRALEKMELAKTQACASINRP
jgi:prefoldin subunit 5